MGQHCQYLRFNKVSSNFTFPENIAYFILCMDNSCSNSHWHAQISSRSYGHLYLLLYTLRKDCFQVAGNWCLIIFKSFSFLIALCNVCVVWWGVVFVALADSIFPVSISVSQLCILDKISLWFLSNNLHFNLSIRIPYVCFHLIHL